MKTSVRLRVQPGARRPGLVGWMADGTLKLAVSEPPEGGRANRAVVGLLADVLGVHETMVRVVRGHGARTKQVEVDGLDEPTVLARIGAALAATRARSGPGGARRRDGR